MTIGFAQIVVSIPRTVSRAVVKAQMGSMLGANVCKSWKVVEGGDGRLALSSPITAESMTSATKDLPDGAYTSLRTYGKSSFVLLDSHFDRLEESARFLGGEVTLRRDELRRLLGIVARELPSAQSLLRITVAVPENMGETWISGQELRTPSADDYRDGVFARTVRMHRDNPRAKNNAFVEISRRQRELIRGRINEVLMIGDDDEILEGLSSNFFGVKNGTIVTADEGVLPGLTRTLLLEAASNGGFPIQYSAIKFSELDQLDEAFISSTSRGPLPVVRIDDMDIANGKPGPLTLRISDLYRESVHNQLEHL